MFTYETVIRLSHTDAAGVIFFARLFDLLHLAYEAFLDEIGQPLPHDLPVSDVVTPIVHASAEYRSPLRLNDRITIEVAVDKIGDRSFTLSYRVRHATALAAEARTVHAAMARSDGRSRALPDGLAAALRATEAGDG